MVPRRVLITGATDGIGSALAQLLESRGDEVLRLGRRAAEDLDPALRGADYLEVDLAGPDATERVLAGLESRGIASLDLLVHNAATGYFGDPWEQSAESIRELISVNLDSPLRLSLGLHEHLRRARGKVVFISSVAAWLPCPDYAVYGATKAALDGFARSWRAERGEVEIQVIHPGATRTGLHEKIGLPREVADWKKFPPAEEVAAAVAAALDRRSSQVTIGFGNRVLGAIGRGLAVPLDALQRRRRARCAR